MKAFALTDFDTAPAITDLPTPDPGLGQVRIRVHAAALNGIDVAVSSGQMRSMVDYRFPVVIGFDGAGIVDASAKESRASRSATRSSATTPSTPSFTTARWPSTRS